MLTLERQNDGSWRHICIFPSDHNSVKLFIELYVEVIDSFTNDTTLSQNLSVETVGKPSFRLGNKEMWSMVMGL